MNVANWWMTLTSKCKSSICTLMWLILNDVWSDMMTWEQWYSKQASKLFSQHLLTMQMQNYLKWCLFWIVSKSSRQLSMGINLTQTRSCKARSVQFICSLFLKIVWWAITVKILRLWPHTGLIWRVSFYNFIFHYTEDQNQRLKYTIKLNAVVLRENHRAFKEVTVMNTTGKENFF